MIALTGAAGGIGSILARGLGRPLRLLDIRPAPGCELLDLRDLAAVERALEGVEAVIHLGAIPTEATFGDILQHNLVGTYNVLEAARRRGVRRVVFASSNHVTGMYRRSERVGPQDPIRPDTYYGVSKAFGEALGRLYAEKWGVSVVCIRIGTCIDRPRNTRHLSTWLSPRDAVALFSAAIDAAVDFSIVYGMSANTRGWWDMAGARALGYDPLDNAETFAAEVAEDPSEPFATQGGPYTDPVFAGEQEGRPASSGPRQTPAPVNSPIAPEVAAAELKDHPGWVVERSRVYRDFRFASFVAAIAFVNQVADLAEERAHHPNICVHEWCFVHLELYSHADGGLSRFDVDFALALDRLLGSGAGAVS